MIDYALKYLDAGLSVIPVRSKSKHLIKWGEFQKRKPTKEEVISWWQKWPDANIAICTGAVSQRVIVDIDSEKGRKIMREIIPKDLSMPVATTPSGGKHLWFYSEDTKLRNNVNAKIDCDFRANGGIVLAPPSENGNGKRYAWVKGKSIFDMESPQLPDSYYEYLKKCSPIYNNYNSFSSYADTKAENLVDTVDTLFTMGRRDNDLFHVANILVKGGASKEVALQVLDRLAKTCNPPMSTNVHKEKYQSALNRQDVHERNLAHEVEEWVMSTKGTWMSTEIHKYLGLSTRVHKKNVSEILRRLLDKGVIERFGNKNGHFRRIETEFEVVDKFEIEDSKPLNIEYPLKIDMLSNTYQGNIVIIAGEKEAGKTAFCLKFATLNRNKGMKIRYISTEFGSGELYNRLKRDDSINPDQWIKEVEFGKFFRNEYHDAIRPDAINILDFLEIHEGQFYMIAEQIKKIYQKLRKGICLIAIQKKRGQDLARGGDLSAEKARLYVTLGREMVGKELKNVAQIVYCKNHAIEGRNPRDWHVYYKLGGGHFFKMEDTWKPRQ